MHMVVGLGNPGAEYIGTRHNVGFEVIERLSARHNIQVGRRDFQAVYGDGRIGEARALLVRPMTYMNLSGEAVAAMCRYFKIPVEQVIVVLDEVALPVGQLRLRYQGSAGGHNGMANLIQMLHTDRIPRVRIGVGAARPGKMIGHVLGRFADVEKPLMEEAYLRSAEAIECALAEGFETAMNRYNVRGQSGSKQSVADG